jgi:hypothetical protein
MSGGTNDNAVLCICHDHNGIAVVDLIEKQAGNTKPFDPMRAVAQFSERLHEYGCTTVIGDNYGGASFAFAFDKYGITYRSVSGSASDQYEALEPRINAGAVELLDDPTTIEELLTLVVKGAKVTHESGSHDDHANALALAVNAVLKGEPKTTWTVIDGGGRMISNEGGVVRITQLDDNSRPMWTKVVSEDDACMSHMDRMRRAALGPEWRSKIAQSDPAYQPPKEIAA